MAVSLPDMDAHQQPSDEMRSEWKAFARLDPSTLSPQDPRIDDPRGPLSEKGFRQAGLIVGSRAARAFAELDPGLAGLAGGDVPVLHHPLLPGLLVVPSLVPPEIQKTLLGRMLHRDLSDPKHQTNMHLHYTLPYQEPDPHAGAAFPDSSPSSPSSSSPPPPPRPSFFSLSPSSSSPPCFLPKDPAIHKPLTAHQVLTRRLHWLTLGGQYDWTNRVYPDHEPPPFPPDLARFLETLFPETRAQAAIVNFYTPGDTMMMHRDVSEQTDKGLVSLSFGCDCLFMIAPDTPLPDPGTQLRPKKYLLLRLRSGDAIYMTREARYAWHGVPKVIRGTCPEYLRKWPSENGQYTAWEGWMDNKRINLNVRQMTD
ncbi:hypothetical protein E4U42_005045 [Claviceps africana]|uniref:mRNA N(6)-methyladenine demethylase n=1 Tax=Claviceps africana TaxID=83212 RepID=A0A8K0NKC4_9HYPO|nr:hypothetical protein E4U42_005045 [Claviceps africana]